MIGSVIFFTVLAFLAMSVIKYFTGRNKPAMERSAMEKIVCSIMVKHRQQMEEAADSMRTVEISREEGIQKCKDATIQLDQDYKSEVKTSMLRKQELEDNLPKMKSKPGVYEGKARLSKGKRDEAKKSGKPEAVWTAHENNAYMYLEYKSKAIERVKKAEKQIEELGISLEVAQAMYEGRRASLDDLLAEFESMTTAISASKFNSSINLIKSLREESIVKLREQRVEVEAQNLVNGNDESSSASVDKSKFSEELENL